MNDEGMASTTSIDDLPTEMLCKIIQLLDLSDIQKSILLQVSRRWNAIVDETIGIRMYTGETSEFFYAIHKYSPLPSVLEKGISCCTISNVPDEDFSVTFCRPFLLQRLRFIGKVSAPIFSSALLENRFTQLSSITFHVTTLSSDRIYLNSYKLEQLSFLGTLENLTIYSDNLTRTHLEEYNMEMCFQNLLALLQLQFSSLHSFTLEYPLFLDKEIQLFLHMMKFISNHVGVLLFLELRFIYRWNISTASAQQRTMDDINFVNDALLALNESVEVLVPTNLHSLNFSIDDRSCVCPTSLTVRETMLVQKQLVRMEYMCWNYVPIPVEVLKANAATLKHVRLTVDDLAAPVDGEIFASLINLKKLTLEADGEVEFNNIAVEAPRLKNAYAFPKSLRSLELRNIYVSVHDTEIFAKDFPCLKTLILVNIGRVDNLGMTMSTLLWILRCSPTIQLLKVKGLNSECFKLWDNGETSGCPHCPDGLHLSPFQCMLIDRVAKVVPKSSKKVSKHPQFKAGPFLRSNPGDRKMLRDLFATTNMNTKFIPMIERCNRKWNKVSFSQS